MDELVVKLRLLAKAELILLRLHLRRTVKQAAFYIVAALLAVLAVGMLNVALYLYLSTLLESARAALVVALADLALAAVVILAAGRMHLGPEADAANALRELTMSELVSDIERVKTQIADLSDDVKTIRSAVTGFMNLGSVGLPSLLQWLPVLLGLFRRKKHDE
jgi:hypothetical protein